MQISIPIPSHAQLHGGGFEAGLFHPVLGLDHLLAMVAVGIVATIVGGRGVYLIPLAFVAIMFVGSLFGINNITWVNDEWGIAFSVFILGLFIMISKSYPLLLGILLVGFFGFFHGHAHGLEIPKISSATYYVMGFLLSTILLHLLGVFIGLFGQKFEKGAEYISSLGAFIMFIGIYILYRLY